MKVIYSPRYDFNFFGLEKLHPFDAKKFSRAWALLPELHADALMISDPVSDDELLRVHTEAYLKSLKHAVVLGRALEFPIIDNLPAKLTELAILNPMRLAVAGTILAARTALAQNELVFNLSGGYHHAKPNNGEGFCLFNDIAVAIACVRADGFEKNIVYIDLDAHQGNGVAHCFLEDRSVWLFDQFNENLYPNSDTIARERLDWPVPLANNTNGSFYLDQLKTELPKFLATVASMGDIGLAIYNAGTDVYEKDQLGGLKLTEADVLERDLFVLAKLRAQNLPTVVVPSGGYSDASHRMIATTIRAVFSQKTN
jgi:histone deacetylase 11